MSLRFKLNGGLGEQAVRLLKDQVDEAGDELGDDERSLPERVHRARQGLKKARAMARLLRGEAKRRRLRQVQTLCRDAGRILSEVRDAQVLRQTGRDLFARYRETVPLEQLASLQATLRRLARRLIEDAAKPERLKLAGKEIHRAAEAAARLRPVSRGWEALEDGLTKTYREARQGYLLCRRQPTPEFLHDWRKQTKYVRYQVESLCESHSPKLEALAAKLHRLSDLLGELHDLDVFRAAMRRADVAAAEMRAVDRMVDARQRELEQSSLELGAELFGERAVEFAEHLHAEWKSA